MHVLSVQGQTFTESAAAWKLNITGAKDGGHAWGDYDGDGDFDLLLNRGENASGGDSRLYRNDGSSFTDVTGSLAPELDDRTRERSAIWADLNNDGRLDFIRNTGASGNPDRPMEIYLQDPASGRFGNGTGGNTPITVGESNSSNVKVANGINTEAVGVLDFDGDGDLDIYFDNHDYGIDILRNNYINHLTGAVVNPAPASLFSHVTPNNSPLGLPQSASDGDYGACGDINNDGWVDLAIRKRDASDVFFNQGGTFGSGYNVAQASNNNKGAISLCDLDNDADLDLIWSDNDGNRILRRDANGWTLMNNVLPSVPNTGVDGIAYGDVDNDGDLDIFLCDNTRGYLYLNQLNSSSGANTGSAFSFTLLNNSFHQGRNGEGVTMVDIDHDGDLDIYVNITGSSSNNSANQLFINNLYTTATPDNDRKSFYVEVLDDRSYMQNGSRRLAIGATVRLYNCQGEVISGLREVNGGNGHGTQDPGLVHFGLPYGRDYNYLVEVSYVNYTSNGSTSRKVVRKWHNPAQAANTPLRITTSGTSEVVPVLSITDLNITEFQLQAEVSGGLTGAAYTYTWTDPDGFVVNGQTISPQVEGLYEAEARDVGGCTLTATRSLSSFPVEWLDFYAERQGSAVLLHWATASELNNDYFRVERSPDGRAFEVIGTVAGHGTTSEVNTYRFADPASLRQRTWYRLSQVDLDGKTQLSPVVEVHASAAQGDLTLLGMFPQPAGDELHAEVYLSEGGTLAAEWLDLQGRRIGADVWTATPGLNQFTLPVASLPPGIYVLHLRLGRELAQARFIVR
ncbi:MAG: FG-GAP-like repeat-containing protein [Bacteroidia bacterium]|nr:FG-GAP-like repeat-containing protein [Bacteroidia bacterium]